MAVYCGVPCGANLNRNSTFGKIRQTSVNRPLFFAATVINELAEEIQGDEFNNIFLKNTSIATIQRMGYLLENILDSKSLADELYKKCQINKLTFFRTPLRTAHKTKGAPSDERWKIIINAEIEMDE